MLDSQEIYFAWRGMQRGRLPVALTSAMQARIHGRQRLQDRFEAVKRPHGFLCHQNQFEMTYGQGQFSLELESAEVCLVLKC